MTSGTQIAETATDGTEERSKLKKLGMRCRPERAVVVHVDILTI
jgi:hypothetical protein